MQDRMNFSWKFWLLYLYVPLSKITKNKRARGNDTENDFHHPKVQFLWHNKKNDNDNNKSSQSKQIFIVCLVYTQNINAVYRNRCVCCLCLSPHLVADSGWINKTKKCHRIKSDALNINNRTCIYIHPFRKPRVTAITTTTTTAAAENRYIAPKSQRNNGKFFNERCRMNRKPN